MNNIELTTGMIAYTANGKTFTIYANFIGHGGKLNAFALVNSNGIVTSAFYNDRLEHSVNKQLNIVKLYQPKPLTEEELVWDLGD